MTALSLRYLEERLYREAPGMSWKCEPVSSTSMLSGTLLPEEILIKATTREGMPVKGSPFYLSGECLVRWGIDASATLICNELKPSEHALRHRAGLDWDRLAEI